MKNSDLEIAGALLTAACIGVWLWVLLAPARYYLDHRPRPAATMDAGVSKAGTL